MTAWRPRGFGLFCRRITREWDAGDAARYAAKIRAARVRTVALCAEGEDGFVAKPIVIARAAETVRELASARVVVYSLPSPDAVRREPERVAERLHVARIAAGADGLIGDHEIAFKGRLEQAVRYRRVLLDGADEGVWVGSTSYPIPEWHPDIPWTELAIGAGIPQLYETARDRRLARRAIADWRALHGRDVQPALAAFETSSPGEGVVQLQGDLLRVCIDDAGALDVDGAWIWVDAALDAEERRVMAAWAERCGW